MNTTSKLRNRKWSLRHALVMSLGSYAIRLSGLASRLASFQQFCEKGVVADPAHFGED